MHMSSPARASSGQSQIEDPARRIASQHKRMLEAHLANSLSNAGLKDAKACASKIWHISEGAMVMILIHGDMSYCDKAEEAALEVVRRKHSPIRKSRN